MYKCFFKRFFDIILSLLAIVILLPLYLILSILVLISMGAPIFFCQNRVGKNEKVFKMYKYRTMSGKRDQDGNLLPDDMRVTKVGRFLRGSSLDELPELFNILIGDISIVGPRPLLVEYLPYYTDEEGHRHDVRGGLTVPEVLHDTVTPTWDQQLRFEAEYAKNVSLKLDIKIIFLTFVNLFKRNRDGYGNYVRSSLINERTVAKNEVEK